MFQTPITVFLNLVLLVALAACTQPGSGHSPETVEAEIPRDAAPTSDTSPTSPMTAPNTDKPESTPPPTGQLKPPVGAINSPGPGSPSGPVDANLTTQTIQGGWTLLVTSAGDRADIRLIGKPGLAAGKIEMLSPWPFDGKPPAVWMFLALGQLTLSDEDGAVVWSGESHDHQKLVGHLGATREPSELVRSEQ